MIIMMDSRILVRPGYVAIMYTAMALQLYKLE